jgi:hypothetical protein
MIASRKKLRRILKHTSREMKRRRTCPLSVRQEREKERVTRVTMRSKPHIKVRRN